MRGMSRKKQPRPTCLPTPANIGDLTGARFHNLTVLGFAGFRERSRGRAICWWVRCDCGHVMPYQSNNLGRVSRCAKCPRTRLIDQTEYHSWRHQTEAGWSSFAAFVAEVGRRPAKGVLCRIDLTRPIGPGNARWGTKSESTRSNKPGTRAVWIKAHGLRLTMAQWAERMGVSRQAVAQRLQRLPAKQAVSLTPVKHVAAVSQCYAESNVSLQHSPCTGFLAAG